MDDQYLEDCTNLMKSRSTITRDEYIIAMKEMDKKWPGKGWKEQAEELLAHYQKYGIPTDQKPARKDLLDGIPF